MRRADCAPLNKYHWRRAVPLASVEEYPSSVSRGDGEGTGSDRQELRRRLLAYGLKHCLTPSQREAIQLCCVQGLNATQAAAMVGIHPSTMSRRLNRAMDLLRQLAAS